VENAPLNLRPAVSIHVVRYGYLVYEYIAVRSCILFTIALRCRLGLTILQYLYYIISLEGDRAARGPNYIIGDNLYI